MGHVGHPSDPRRDLDRLYQSHSQYWLGDVGWLRENTVRFNSYSSNYHVSRHKYTFYCRLISWSHLSNGFWFRFLYFPFFSDIFFWTSPFFILDLQSFSRHRIPSKNQNLLPDPIIPVAISCYPFSLFRPTFASQHLWTHPPLGCAIETRLAESRQSNGSFRMGKMRENGGHVRDAGLYLFIPFQWKQNRTAFLTMMNSIGEKREDIGRFPQNRVNINASEQMYEERFLPPGLLRCAKNLQRLMYSRGWPALCSLSTESPLFFVVHYGFFFSLFFLTEI